MFSQQFELGFVIKVMIHFHRLLLSLTDFIADFAAPKSLIRHPKLQFNPTHLPTHHLRTNETPTLNITWFGTTAESEMSKITE